MPHFPGALCLVLAGAASLALVQRVPPKCAAALGPRVPRWVLPPQSPRSPGSLVGGVSGVSPASPPAPVCAAAPAAPAPRRKQKALEELERERKREEKLRRREQKQRERESRRSQRKLQKLQAEEQRQLHQKIRLEERRLLLAQRNLQSLRLVAELLSRAKVPTWGRGPPRLAAGALPWDRAVPGAPCLWPALGGRRAALPFQAALRRARGVAGGRRVAGRSAAPRAPLAVPLCPPTARHVGRRPSTL